MLEREVKETTNDLPEFNRDVVFTLIEQYFEKNKLLRLQNIKNSILAQANNGEVYCILTLLENERYNEITYLLKRGFDVLPFHVDENENEIKFLIYFGESEKLDEFKSLMENMYSLHFVNLNVDRR